MTTQTVLNKNDFAPCPFCGKHEITFNEWYVNDEVVDAIECASCYGSAPVASWNIRNGILLNPQEQLSSHTSIIENARTIDWLNTKTNQTTYGVQVKIDGKWKNYAENSAPVFGTLLDMKNKCRDLMKVQEVFHAN